MQGLIKLTFIAEPSGGCDVGTPVPTPAQPTPAVGSSSQPQLSAQQLQHDQAAGQEQLQSLMANIERHLQHAQAMQGSTPQVNSQVLEALQRQAGAAGSSRPQSLGGISNTSAGAAEALQSLLGTAAAAASSTAADSTAGAGNTSAQPQRPPLLLQLGPALARSVQQTQLFRMLAAMLLAYAVLSGWQLGLPPFALLLITDVAAVLAGAAVLPNKPSDAAGGGDVQVPWRLRSLDLFSLVPGLRELVDSLKGYNAVATAVSQDFAAYVVTCGVLLTTDLVPAAVNWGLRY